MVWILTEYADKTIDFKDAVNVISDVTKYVNLGVQLFIPSEKLNEINQYAPEERKIKVIQAWFEHDSYPTYGTLHRALLQSSVSDKRAAMKLSGLSRTDSMNSSVSVDGIQPESSTVEEGVYSIEFIICSLKAGQHNTLCLSHPLNYLLSMQYNT